MRKKILNVFLLTFGLMTLIIFLLPIKKFAVGDGGGFAKVMFYILNAIMLSAVTILIILSIVNLFKDDYSKVKLMELLALVGVIMVYLVLIIFASIPASRIYLGYSLVAVEIFLCSNINLMARVMRVGDKGAKKSKSKNKKDEEDIEDK